MPYYYRSFENRVDQTNPTDSLVTQGSQMSEFIYRPTFSKSAPFNVTNVKNYDRRKYSLQRFLPDVWTERFIDGTTGQWRTATYTRYYPVSIEYGLPEGLMNNVRGMSINACLNNLRQGSTQMGANMAEAKKTLEQVGGTSIQVLQAALAAFRGRWGDIPRYLDMKKSDILTGRFPANRWLEYQYGWKPLLSDIHDGVLLAKEGLRKPNTYFSAQGRAHDTDSRTQLFGSPPTQGFYQEHSVRSTTKMYYQVSNQTIDSLDRFGLLNPLSIAWELTPFSFIFDWFIPVGNVLSALSAPAGLKLISGYTNVKVESKFRRSRVGPDPATNRYWSQYSTVESDAKVFGRNVFYSFPTPRLVANTHPFSTTRILNAIALIRGAALR